MLVVNANHDTTMPAQWEIFKTLYMLLCDQHVKWYMLLVTVFLSNVAKLKSIVFKVEMDKTIHAFISSLKSICFVFGLIWVLQKMHKKGKWNHTVFFTKTDIDS